MRTSTDTSAGVPADYIGRVNRAIDHIVARLHEPLCLQEIARVGCFSPFHFHRVFKSLVGETLHGFIKRVGLERALQMMSHKPSRSLTEIGLACGFKSSSEFSRSFKARYGVPPSAFEIESFRCDKRSELVALGASGDVSHQFALLPPGENPDGFRAEVRTLPPRTVAYIRMLDPFASNEVVRAADRLMAWADARGDGGRQWLGYMWEDPDIVALAGCRYDVGVEVDDVEPVGEIGRYDFPAMQVAQVEVRGNLELEQRALDWLFCTWLPRSGYVPDALPCFEAWIGRPFAHGHEHFELYAQLPVTRA